MKHATHPKQVRAARIALALLAILAAGAAAGQAGTSPSAGAAQAAPRSAPAPAGPSYGPVLHPQPVRSEPGAQPEQTPQAQEEKSGAAPAARPLEPDPSARPAPQPSDAAKQGTRKEDKKRGKRSARLSPAQRVDIVPPAPPGPFQRQASAPPVQPVAVVPAPAQINGCTGGVCTDTGGTSYNMGNGNAAVNSQGRLCTRSGNTMQCF